jgi:hypothetical protein
MSPGAGQRRRFTGATALVLWGEVCYGMRYAEEADDAAQAADARS